MIVDFDRDYTVTSAFRLLSWSTFPSNTEPIRTHLTEAIMRDKDGVDIYHSTCTLDLIFIQCSSFTYDPYDSQLPVDNAEKFCQWLLEEFSHEGSTVMFAPAAGFYSSNGMGMKEIRIAYVLNEDDLNKAMDCLEVALVEYNK